MMTIFSIPKPFLGKIKTIQRNSIRSWLQLLPRPEVILFGEEEGIAETAREFGIRHISKIKKNELGTPLLGPIFNSVKEVTESEFLVYTNSDIIFPSDFILALGKVNFPLFLMTGRRWDLDVTEPIKFEEAYWEEKIHQAKLKRGKLHGPSGIDYYVFPRALEYNMPDFPVGRPGWDNWLFWKIRSLKIPVIDATQAMTVIHQNHGYGHHPQGKSGVFEGEEAKKNIRMAGGFTHFMTLRDADWILTPKGLERQRSLLSKLSLFYLWRLALSLRRRLRSGL